MLSSLTRPGPTTLVGVLVLSLAAAAPAQPIRRLPPTPQGGGAFPLNRPGMVLNPTGFNSPLFRVNPFLLNYGQNLVNLARVDSRLLPAALGFNPAMSLTGFNPYASVLTNPYLTGTAPLLGYGTGLSAATLTSNPYATSSGLADPYAASGSAAYGGMPYPPYSTYYDPSGGYERGVGDLTKAYGQYAKDVNQARLLNQQVEQSKIETRRRIFDEWRYERAHMPTAEDISQKRRDLDLRVARGQPQSTDILSARSLNDLLAHLKAMHGKSHRGGEVRLDEDLLKKINVKTDFGGNIGLFKNGGKLLWPVPLRAAAFDELRKAFALHAEDAVDRARVNGKPVDVVLIKDLQTELASLHDLLERNVGSMTTEQYIDAKRYLNLLDDSLRALQDPNVANYFNRKYEASGKTVADLVDNMRKDGLTFAAATPGDEAAYRALQSYLAAYDDSVTRLASR